MTEAAAPPKPTANLDAASVAEGSLPESAFPGTFQRDFRIHFDEKVHDEIKKHAAETVDVELCGVLMGKVLKDRDGPYLSITGAIRGEQAKHDGAQVTFTHDTWDHIHKVKDQKFPKEQIVGWYHTHPGFGIFLSGMDLFIHEFFFNTATQIAHVIDPRSGEEGVFTWRGGKVERAAKFWIGAREKPCATGPTGTRPVLPRVTPIVIAFAFGYLLARFLAPMEVREARADLLRAEVRDLVSSAASAYASAEELRGVERRLGDLASSGATAPGTKAEIALIQSQVQALRQAAGAREDAIARALHDRGLAGATIEEEFRTLRVETLVTRRVAIDSCIYALRSRLDLAGEKAAAGVKQSLDELMGSEPNEARRQAIRGLFPELYAKPEAKPQGPQAK